MDEKHVNGAPDSAELVKPVVSAALEQQQETSLEITSLNIDTQSSESAEAETQAVNEKTKAKNIQIL